MPVAMTPVEGIINIKRARVLGSRHEFGRKKSRGFGCWDAVSIFAL
jgi:hypothetical protein